MLRTIAFLIAGMASTTAWAWGEAGHNTVGRVAVRLLTDKNVPELARVMAPKEYMMGHLSNIPDIHWRNIGKKTADLNGPTHFVDAEYVLSAGTRTPANLLPETMAAYANSIQSNCDKPKAPVAVCPEGATMSAKLNKTGTAPLRFEQLIKKMQDALAKAKKAKSHAEMVEDVNEALLYAGLASHFIGDMAQPLHVTKNYDGWENGAGGLHSYFETDIVDALGLGLPDRVYKYAKAKKPAAALWEKIPAAERKSMKPVDMAWLVVLDSLEQVNRLFELDRKNSWLKASIDGGKKKKPAERKPAQDVSAAYEGLVEERLAVAADALSDAWILAWKAAGSPDLKEYQSWHYELAPEFIAPEYLGPFLKEGKGS